MQTMLSQDIYVARDMTGISILRELRDIQMEMKRAVALAEVYREQAQMINKLIYENDKLRKRLGGKDVSSGDITGIKKK